MENDEKMMSARHYHNNGREGEEYTQPYVIPPEMLVSFYQQAVLKSNGNLDLIKNRMHSYRSKRNDEKELKIFVFSKQMMDKIKEGLRHKYGNRVDEIMTLHDYHKTIRAADKYMKNSDSYEIPTYNNQPTRGAVRRTGDTRRRNSFNFGSNDRNSRQLAIMNSSEFCTCDSEMSP
jgi:hypothetical protein